MRKNFLITVGGSEIQIKVTVNNDDHGGNPIQTNHVNDMVNSCAVAAYNQVLQALPENVQKMKLKSCRYNIELNATNYTRMVLEGGSFAMPIAIAFASIALNKKVPRCFAFTGGLFDRGPNIFVPVGGLNCKITAAIEEGYQKLFYPYSNRQSIVDTVDPELLRRIDITPVDNLSELLEIIFGINLNSK